MRLLTDAVRGEYSDRVMAKHSDLRLYTLTLKSFEDFQTKVTYCRKGGDVAVVIINTFVISAMILSCHHRHQLIK